MLARVFTCAVIGLNVQLVEVEVDTGRGLPSFFLVGLPDAAMKESSERVRSAIRNSGLHMHGGRVTVNLAPADMRKAGPSYDLPIAVGVLAATDQIPTVDLERALLVGELSLDGFVRHVRGILPISAFAAANGFKTLLVPRDDSAEAALVSGLEVLPIDTLSGLVNHLHGLDLISSQPTTQYDIQTHSNTYTDFQDIKGQEHVKRALEIAAAGAHNLLMVGPLGREKHLLPVHYRVFFRLSLLMKPWMSLRSIP